eukprot:EG_transcript_12714
MIHSRCPEVVRETPRSPLLLCLLIFSSDRPVVRVQWQRCQQAASIHVEQPSRRARWGTQGPTCLPSTGWVTGWRRLGVRRLPQAAPPRHRGCSFGRCVVAPPIFPY